MRKIYLVISSTVAATTALTLTACSSSGTSSAGSAGTSHAMGAASSMGMSSTAMNGTSSMGTSSGSIGMSTGSMGMSGSALAAASGAASGPNNDADVSFATDMIPHHEQALTMASLALTKATDPRVKQLAQAINGEQTPEISTMTGWLKGWNKPVPTASMGGMSMGGTSMPGMMSDADMSKLSAATGSAFDKLWLTQMITHHEGAVTMAKTELAAGQNSDAKALATSIIGGQSKEIAEMKTILPTIK